MVGRAGELALPQQQQHRQLQTDCARGIIHPHVDAMGPQHRGGGGGDHESVCVCLCVSDSFTVDVSARATHSHSCPSDRDGSSAAGGGPVSISVGGASATHGVRLSEGGRSVRP